MLFLRMPDPDRRRAAATAPEAEPGRGAHPEPVRREIIDTEMPVLPTTGMSDGQRSAMEVAESARDGGPAAGFGAALLAGSAELQRLLPFPRQSDAERAAGDELVERVSRFLAERLDPEAVDESRTIPADVLEGLHAMGVFRMKVPVEHGGLGLSQVNYNRVVAAIASWCGSTAVTVSAHQSIGVPQPLKMFGTEEQKRRYFPRIAAGELTAFALTEPEAGSDPARLKTTAALSADGTHYVLNGEKLWTTNGPIAGLLVVMARTADKVVRGRTRQQITALLVDANAPGVEVLHRCDFMGLRAIHNGLMRFDDVRVPVEDVLWGEGLGLKLALRTLNTGRLTLPAACAGIGKRCLSIARRWGELRQQWGRPVGRHEAGSDKVAEIAAATFAMEAVADLAAHWADQGRDVRIEAAMAKLFCSETCWRVVDLTLQLRGGRGYERASSLRARGEWAPPVERIMRDCRINTIIEGTTDIMRLFLAREALDPHLRRAGVVLDASQPAGRRATALLRAAGHYAAWYPGQLAARRLPRRWNELGPLAAHGRFIDAASHRLAAALFAAMVRCGPRLERRQALLGHLMEVGTELFAMSAACAAARSETAGPGAVELADLFCRQARTRVQRHFADARSGLPRRAGALAGRVLDGEMRWLEAGIVEDGEEP